MKFTLREFNQDVSAVKRAAEKAPVIITDRGKPAFVLMRHDQYRRLSSRGESIVSLLAQSESDPTEFEPPRLGDETIEGVIFPA